MGKKEELIRIAVEAGTKAGVEAYRKEMRKDLNERVDRRLYNTKLLLRNYRMFKAHVENAIYDIQEQTEESIFDILTGIMTDKPDTFVSSIRRSIGRTRTIVEHIDAMLKFYEIYCEKSKNPEEARRFRIIKSYYIDEDKMTIDELADQENVVRRTIYRDIDIACERLAALLFGIDGIRKAR